jgi:8-amino-7-oxononanoate synthase
MHLAHVGEQIERLAMAGLLRLPDDDLVRSRLGALHGAAFLDLSSNDYLGLRGARGAVSRETPLPDRPPPDGAVSRETHLEWGAGSSRLLYGTVPEHLAMEKVVASWLGHPAALLFTSGYAANVGALSSLLDEEDCVVSDALNHASIIDGIRLSRARPVIVPHLNLGAIEQALLAGRDRPARWVVTESYFSMDGDGPDLVALRALCDRFDAHLYVDEAHALGVFGPRGSGRLPAAGVRAEVVMAAFGKAVGGQGACVCSSPVVRTWLWNRARSFVFSTALSPVLAEGLLVQVQRTKSAGAARIRVEEVSRAVRAGLRAQGWPLSLDSFGPIVSLQLGEAARALELAAALEKEGVLVQAIRPPTVPEGRARIRLTLHAQLQVGEVERLLRLTAAFAPGGGRAPT